LKKNEKITRKRNFETTQKSKRLDLGFQ